MRRRQQHRTRKSMRSGRTRKARRSRNTKRVKVHKRTKTRRGGRRVKHRGRRTSYRRRGGTTEKSPRQQLLEMAKDAEEAGQKSAAYRFRDMAEDLPVTPGSTPASTPPASPERVKKDGGVEESPHTRAIRRAEEGNATPPRVFVPHKKNDTKESPQTRSLRRAEEGTYKPPYKGHKFPLV